MVFIVALKDYAGEFYNLDWDVDTIEGVYFNEKKACSVILDHLVSINPELKQVCEDYNYDFYVIINKIDAKYGRYWNIFDIPVK